LHGWDPLTPIEETLRFLDDAAQAGQIHYVACRTSSVTRSRSTSIWPARTDRRISGGRF
jgi:aryl-alcohol dehydrogenase-like predicted oxidoreductase